MTRITVSADGRIHVKTSFQSLDKCKSIPGGRWSTNRKAWMYPATPAAAKNIADAFILADWDDAARDLLQQARQIEQAAAFKSADLMSPIPLTKIDPWKHQLAAYHFAYAMPAAMLAVGMGGGKTKIAVDLIVNRGCRRILVICPSTVVPIWPMQVARHAGIPLRTLALDDKSVKLRTASLDTPLRDPSPLVVIVNYEAAWREPMAAKLITLPWDAIILDESHRIKDPSGRASLFCAKLKAPIRLCLTGTPCPHSPLDIFAQFRFLDRGIFGSSFIAFRLRYAIMGGYGNHQIIGWQNGPELERKIAAITFRVKTEDVLDLPPVHDVDRPCALAADAAALYKQLEKEFVAEVADGTVTASNALTRLLRLQQVTSGHLTDDDKHLHTFGCNKATVLRDLLTDIDPAEPVVVFARFTHDLDTIRMVANQVNRPSQEISGRMDDVAGHWKPTAPGTVLAAQIQSGKEGIDLTAACHCIYYSLGFSLGDYEQSRKRTHRPGQTRPTRYFHVITTGTVDALVYAALAARQEVVEAVFRNVQQHGRFIHPHP